MKWIKPGKRIWTTLFLLIALGATLSIMTAVYYQIERDRCFRRLTGYVD